jgi:hypothetical protein
MLLQEECGGEMKQGHTGSKHQGRAKVTVDQSVADFQDRIAYVADARSEKSLEQCNRLYRRRPI